MDLINTNFTSTSDSHESLWRFALALYARQGIAETCLQLQDERKVNVCLLIGLHWLDIRGCVLSTADLTDLTEHTHKWAQEIIEQLRALRRTLKKSFDNFPSDELQEQVRGLIKQAELLAEKKLLVEIARWSTTISVSEGSVSNSNIERYLTSLGIDEIFIESVIQKLTKQ